MIHKSLFSESYCLYNGIKKVLGSSKIAVDVLPTLILSAESLIPYILLMQMLKDPKATRQFRVEVSGHSQNSSEITTAAGELKGIRTLKVNSTTLATDFMFKKKFVFLILSSVYPPTPPYSFSFSLFPFYILLHLFHALWFPH